jgi:hypothetical protein
MFRLRQGAVGPVVDVDTFQQLVLALVAGKRGRFRIDEIIRNPLASGPPSRSWGVGIKRADGDVVILRGPWL